MENVLINNFPASLNSPIEYSAINTKLNIYEDDYLTYLIHGIKGIGKSRFVKELISSLSQKEANLEWIWFCGDNINMLCEKVLNHFNISEKTISMNSFRARLNKQNKKFIFVFDNVTNVEYIKEFFHKIGRNKLKIILTSRDYKLGGANIEINKVEICERKLDILSHNLPFVLNDFLNESYKIEFFILMYVIKQNSLLDDVCKMILPKQNHIYNKFVKELQSNSIIKIDWNDKLCYIKLNDSPNILNELNCEMKLIQEIHNKENKIVDKLFKSLTDLVLRENANCLEYIEILLIENPELKNKYLNEDFFEKLSQKETFEISFKLVNFVKWLDDLNFDNFTKSMLFLKIGDSCTTSDSLVFYNKAMKLLNLEPINFSDKNGIERNQLLESIVTQLKSLNLNDSRLFDVLKKYEELNKELLLNLNKNIDIRLYNGKYTIIPTVPPISGSFGRVYQVKDCDNNIRAMKEVNIQKNVGLEKLALEQLKNKNHINLVKFFESFESGSIYYFIFEYCEGGSLRQYLKNHKIDKKQSLKWLFQISNALEFIHNLQPQIIHRDIKPENILLENMVAKLGDFGFSALKTGLSSSALTEGIGTLDYMSPEMHGLTDFGELEKTDIWSLGCIIFELIKNRKLFSPANSSNLKNPAELDDEIEDLNNIYKRMLSFEPKLRPTSKEVYETFNSIIKKFEN